MKGKLIHLNLVLSFLEKESTAKKKTSLDRILQS